MPVTCIPRASPPASVVRGHIDCIRQFPDSRFAQAVPALMFLSHPTIFQFDSLISVRSAGPSPPYPFDDAWGILRVLVTTSSTRYVYCSWRSIHTTIRSLSVRRRITTGTSGSRSSSPRRRPLELVPAWWGSESLGQAPCARVVQGNGRGYMVGAQKSKVD